MKWDWPHSDCSWSVMPGSLTGSLCSLTKQRVLIILSLLFVFAGVIGSFTSTRSLVDLVFLGMLMISNNKNFIRYHWNHYYLLSSDQFVSPTLLYRPIQYVNMDKSFCSFNHLLRLPSVINSLTLLSVGVYRCITAAVRWPVILLFRRYSVELQRWFIVLNSFAPKLLYAIDNDKHSLSVEDNHLCEEHTALHI